MLGFLETLFSVRLAADGNAFVKTPKLLMLRRRVLASNSFVHKIIKAAPRTIPGNRPTTIAFGGKSGQLIDPVGRIDSDSGFPCPSFLSLYFGGIFSGFIKHFAPEPSHSKPSGQHLSPHFWASFGEGGQSVG